MADEQDAYDGRRGSHRVLRLAPALAAALGVESGRLVELLGRHPAPLRAWVRIDDGVPDGRIPLDTLGRRMLGVEPGHTVTLRHLSMPSIPIADAKLGANSRRVP